MENIIIVLIYIVFIFLIKFILGIKINDVKKIKEIGYNKELAKITDKLPPNKQICKEILKKLENENVKIEETEIQVPVAGTHFVYNALCAMEVGIILGISTNQIQNGIAKFELTKKRMDIRKLENGAIIINDAYNASYESMRASIEFLANHTGIRKIAVLGDMFELGE